MCACCYLEGRQEYMLDARDFGVKTTGDFYEKYASQGRWARCLDCMRKAGVDPLRSARVDAASNGMPEARPLETSRRRLRSASGAMNATSGSKG